MILLIEKCTGRYFIMKRLGLDRVIDLNRRHKPVLCYYLIINYLVSTI